MTTWNTTYNFNGPKSMNFGQAMLYGAFGQLTGMMGGGCFGGYGMGMGSFGMGGSIFSMGMGMGGFGMGMYGCGMDNGYVGAQCGLAATNILFQAIGGSIKSHKEDKTNQVTKESLEAKAADSLKILKEVSPGITLESFNSTKTASEYDYSSFDTKVNTATEEYNNAKAETAASKADLAPYGGEKGPQETDDKYKKSETKDGVTTTTFDKDKYKADCIEWNRLNTIYENNKKAEAKKKEALTKAENERSNKETAVENAIETLKPIKEQYNEIKSAEEKKAAEAKQKEEAKAQEQAAKAERKKDKEAFMKAWDEFKNDPQNRNKKTAVDNALRQIDDEKLRAKYEKTVKENADYKKLNN